MEPSTVHQLPNQSPLFHDTNYLLHNCLHWGFSATATFSTNDLLLAPLRFAYCYPFPPTIYLLPPLLCLLCVLQRFWSSFSTAGNQPCSGLHGFVFFFVRLICATLISTDLENTITPAPSAAVIGYLLLLLLRTIRTISSFAYKSGGLLLL